MNHKRCLNCDHTVYEKYCANCGQKADTHRINWRYIWHDLPHSTLHLDKGFFYTAKELTIRPGAAVREFLYGKRIKHFRPLAYVLILSVIMTFGVFANDIASDSHATVSTAGGDPSQLTVSGETISNALSKYYGLMVIACVPIYAFFAWLFYRKERNFAEILTGFLFIYGHTTWLGLILALARIVPIQEIEIGLVILWAASLLSYLVWSNTTMFTRYHIAARFFISMFTLVMGFFVSAIVLILGLHYYEVLHNH
jgi:Protein of unknown function (DUF3667)